jgi:hypothetical protein
MFKDILLVLDGSSSVAKLLPLIHKLVGAKTSLTVIYVLDAGWGKLLGDEWISNSSTRRTFFHYMEKKRAQEAQAVLDDLTSQLASSVQQLKCSVAEGEPHRILVTTVKERGPFDLVVLPHPSGANGNGVKLKLDRLCKTITCPVMISR